MFRPASRLMLAATVTSVLATSCDGGQASPTTTSSTTFSPVITTREDDGVLRIGVLLPTSGEAGSFGAPLVAAAELAVEQINAAGGTFGRPVELELRDSGGTLPIALVAIRELLDENVDTVIGPASAGVTLGVLEEIVATGLVACSPTASTLALDGFPDDGLFFRTIPSDSMQAEALAHQIDQTGLGRVAIVFVDDAYGRPFASAVDVAVRARGLTIVSTVGYGADNDEFGSEAAAVLDGEPGVVAVIGDAASGMEVVAAIAERAGPDAPTFVVNDALRAPLAQPVLSEIDAATLESVIGVAPAALGLNEAFAEMLGEADGPYALNAYDCVNLVTLAAAQAGTDAPDAIADAIPSVSSGGSTCFTYEQCTQLLADGRNIDYGGPDGHVEIDSAGETATARFDLFSFTRDGVDETSGSFTLSV